MGQAPIQKGLSFSPTVMLNPDFAEVWHLWIKEFLNIFKPEFVAANHKNKEILTLGETFHLDYFHR
jgi:hypothetical protein